ncbi:MAG: DegT/DnrJ/EryC1/StrS family aminotransferase, partial [Lachnospiraceae bacterium]|nr:DegT/DnrJ/EryC1/StrS family aminotransferase [Lachnospiraceae bacterium]
IDKYTWEAFGSSYLPSELNAAYLLPQLEIADEINDRRREIWYRYYEGLSDLRDAGRIELPFVPEGCVHNGHIFYLKTKDLAERTALIGHLKERGILAVFHYIPLHSSPAGLKYGRFHGEDRFTTAESERLLRLPLYYSLTDAEADEVISEIHTFYGAK